MRGVGFACRAAIAAAVLLGVAGCSGPSSGELPSRMPDVEGETLTDAVGELQAKGFEDILLFTSDVHAADPWDGMVDDDVIVEMTDPKPGDESLPQVNLWLGEPPQLPSDVPSDAWYYPHGERIAERGTDSCLTCHERPSCSICHEERLDETDALLSADPADAPDLASAIEAATGVRDIEASDHGAGWYQVEVPWGEGDAREAAASARGAALAAFPVGFSAQSDAQTVVLRFVAADGRTLIEIGFERTTYEAQDWDSVTESDIPWIADRYAVPSI